MAIKNMAKYMAERRKKNRDRSIVFLGGKCNRCGGVEGLEIDHIERRERSFQLSGKGLDVCWNKIKKELRKCQLLCGGCHLDKSYEVGDLVRSQHGSYRKYISGCRCCLCRVIPRNNARRYRKKHKKQCQDCLEKIDHRADRCRSCALKKRHKNRV